MAGPIVVTGPLIPEAIRVLEREAGRTIRFWDEDRPIPEPLLHEWARDAEGLLTTLNDRIDARLMEAAPHLQVVANMAVGFDNIDVAAASGLGVLCTNTPDVLTEATAELTWALILALMRGIVPARNALMAGHWKYWRVDGYLGAELMGRTLGIVGGGRIGTAVARRAAPFGMRVMTAGKQPAPERVPLDELLAAADVVSLHVPLTADTRGMVNREWLSRMRPRSFLVNTARGGVVEEGALLEALDSGHLAGAALDVFDREPISGDHPLARHPRVLATPHIGSATQETRTRMALLATTNLLQALRGQMPLNLLNPSVWPGRAGNG